MPIERYTENTVILPGEWVISVDRFNERRALPPRQVTSLGLGGDTYFFLIGDRRGWSMAEDVIFVCDTEIEAQELYASILKYRGQRERAIREIKQQVDLEMLGAIDMIIFNANKEQ